MKSIVKISIEAMKKNQVLVVKQEVNQAKMELAKANKEKPSKGKKPEAAGPGINQ